MSKKKKKYIQAPTSSDLERIEAGENFADIIASPIRKALDSDDSINDEEPEVEQKPAKKNLSLKRKFYFVLGLFVTIMSIIGIIFTVNFVAKYIQRIAHNTDQKEEFAEYIFPLVMADVPEYNDVSTLPSSTITMIAAYDFIIENDKDKYGYENINGTYTVPATDLEARAKKLFGQNVNLLEDTAGGIDLYISYNPDNKSFYIPTDGVTTPYVPKIESIKQNKDIYELKVGVYNVLQPWEHESDKRLPTKYMKYVLQKNEDNYTIIEVSIIQTDNLNYDL